MINEPVVWHYGLMAERWAECITDAPYNDVNLRVNRGEIYAFLGLNGAGKTTAIRLLLGMIKLTAGSARLLGTNIHGGRQKPWAAVGYLVEAAAAYPELSVRENLEAARRLRPDIEQTAVAQIINLLRLTPYADRRAGTLSQDNAQRLGLAKALIHRPQLLILDEPTNSRFQSCMRAWRGQDSPRRAPSVM